MEPVFRLKVCPLVLDSAQDEFRLALPGMSAPPALKGGCHIPAQGGFDQVIAVRRGVGEPEFSLGFVQG